MPDSDEVASRRELEREFDAKQRDLKAQHKRQLDALQQDRQDWEQHRRSQQQDLANRTEKLRREEENHKRDLEALRQARRELEQAKSLVNEQAGAKAEAQAARAGEADVAHRLARTRSLLGWSSFAGAVGGSAWLYTSLVREAMLSAALAAGFLLVVLLLELGRRRLARAT